MNMNAGWRNRNRAAYGGGGGGGVGQPQGFGGGLYGASHGPPGPGAGLSGAHQSHHAQPSQHSRQQHSHYSGGGRGLPGPPSAANAEDRPPPVDTGRRTARPGWTGPRADGGEHSSDSLPQPDGHPARVRRLIEDIPNAGKHASPTAGSKQSRASSAGVPLASGSSGQREASDMVNGSTMGSGMTSGSRMRRQPTKEEYTSALLQLTSGSFHPGASGTPAEGPVLGTGRSNEGAALSLVSDHTSHSPHSDPAPKQRLSLTAGGGVHTVVAREETKSDTDHAPWTGKQTVAPLQGAGSQLRRSAGSQLGSLGAGEAAAVEVEEEEARKSGWCARGRLCCRRARKSKVVRAIPTSAFVSVMNEASGAKEHNAVISKKCIIDPRTPWLRQWELVLILALVYTATVTPFDVAFLNPSAFTVLFWLNRLIDCMFLADMVMHFFTAVPGDPQLNAQWIQDYPTIAYRYITGWFLIDLLSVFPFDMLSLFFDATELRHLQAIRTLRLLRLAKLFRVLRAVRIFRRWESSININYSLIGLMNFIVLMGVSSHWLACLWRLIVEFEENQWESWLGQTGLLGESSDVQYVAALYWAVMTLSTIGYGDISANTTLERGISLCCMLLGSSIWAYIVGSICGIVSSLDAESLSFRRNMDELNYFMAEEHLPKEMRQRLREYFHQRRALTRALSHQSLLVQMSPSLRQEVAFHTNRRWLRHVSWFQKASKDFVSAVAVHLQPAVYAPKELLHGDEFSIVVRGVAAKDGRILTQGNTWGDDIILTAMEFRRATPARALTYLEVKSMSQDDLYGVLSAFPEERIRIRRIANRLALRRAFVREAKRRLAERRLEEQNAEHRRKVAMGLVVDEADDDGEQRPGSPNNETPHGTPSTGRKSHAAGASRRGSPTFASSDDDMPLRPAYRPGMTTVPMGRSGDRVFDGQGSLHDSVDRMQGRQPASMAGMLVPVVVPRPSGGPMSVLSRYSETDSQTSEAASQADLGELVRTAVSTEMKRAVRETLQTQTEAVRNDIQNMVAALRASQKIASSVRSSGSDSSSSAAAGFNNDAKFVEALRSVASATKPPIPPPGVASVSRRAIASVERQEDDPRSSRGSQDMNMSRRSVESETSENAGGRKAQSAARQFKAKRAPRRVRHAESESRTASSRKGIHAGLQSPAVAFTNGVASGGEEEEEEEEEEGGEDDVTGCLESAGEASRPTRQGSEAPRRTSLKVKRGTVEWAGLETTPSEPQAHAALPGFSGPSLLAYPRGSSNERRASHGKLQAEIEARATPLAGFAEASRGAKRGKDRVSSQTSLVVKPPPK